MSEISEAFQWCDFLSIGSPVYMGMETSQLKSMMDRCVALRPSYTKNPEEDTLGLQTIENLINNLLENV